MVPCFWIWVVSMFAIHYAGGDVAMKEGRDDADDDHARQKQGDQYVC